MFLHASAGPQSEYSLPTNLLQRGRAKARFVTVSHKVAAGADVISNAEILGQSQSPKVAPKKGPSQGGT